jgi:predicted RNA-binding Zn-ribbon protein involved in translation (DUF1610 family)
MEVMETADPYVVLGQRAEASMDELRAAYRRLAQIYHPDRYADAAADVRREAEERMKDLNSAYHAIRTTRGVGARKAGHSRPRAKANALNVRRVCSGCRGTVVVPLTATKFRCNRCHVVSAATRCRGCDAVGIVRADSEAWECGNCGYSEESAWATTRTMTCSCGTENHIAKRAPSVTCENCGKFFRRCEFCGEYPYVRSFRRRGRPSRPRERWDCPLCHRSNNGFRDGHGRGGFTS